MIAKILMKSVLVNSILVASIAFLFLVEISPVAFGSTGNANAVGGMYFSMQPITASPALVKVPVKLSISPKSFTVAPGGTYTGTLTIKNTGTKTITFSSCLYYSKLSTSKKYKKGVCNLEGPITVGGGSSVTEKWSSGVYSGTPAGKYDVKIFLTNSVDESAAGKYTVTIS